MHSLRTIISPMQSLLHALLISLTSALLFAFSFLIRNASSSPALK
jgi:hypothetical protein